MKGLIKALTNSVEYIHKKRIIVASITAFLIGFGVGVLITNLVGVHWIKLPDAEVFLKKSDETLRELQQIKSMIHNLISEKASNSGGKTMVDDKASITPRRNVEAAQGTKNSEVSVGGNKVYIHYARDEDKEMAEAFSHLLRKKGYNFVETEKIQHTSRDVRYFHNEDREVALRLQKQLNDFVASSTNVKKFNVKIKNLGKRYPRAQKGTLEVWVFF